MINLKLFPVIPYITLQVGYENGHAFQLEELSKWYDTQLSPLI